MSEAMNIPDTIFTRDEVLAFIAADRASASRSTPEGWVCVPRDATLEMIRAGCENREGPTPFEAYRPSEVDAIYADMVAAAPALTANQAAEAPPVAPTDAELDELARQWANGAPIVLCYDGNGRPIDGWEFSMPRFRSAVRAALNKEPK